MAVNRRKKQEPLITGGDIRLLLCAALFLCAVIFRYGDDPRLDSLRNRIQTFVNGNTSLSGVISAFGGSTGNNSQDVGEQEVYSPEDQYVQALAESSGAADDVTERRKTRYPDTVDKTLYVMTFAHQNPLEGTVTSAFGGRDDPIDGAGDFHYGLDIAAPEGTQIGAIADGEVLETGVSASYGNYLVVSHADGFTSLYAHCSEVTAQAGALVKMGDPIALVGATGRVTGNHLHLEIWKNGNAVDPASFVSYA
ncbi:MAG: M23 family metallopeptidase [Clostridiaceae bacterium]|nr:M23 family metallopeptidase [Clostridiaceae bacterium]